MKRQVIALALAAALPLAAQAADGITYNYVQGGYVYSDVKGPDADGWGLNGSVAVHPNFHLIAEYNNQDVKHSSAGFEQSRIGGGYNTAIGKNTDFVADIAYDVTKVKHGGPKAEGYSVETGVRSLLMPNVEGYAKVGYMDTNKTSGEAFGRLGANVMFNQNWGLNADVRLIQGGERQYFIGPRFTW
ncbi:diffusible signal factor-reguated Ax21 faimly protein [Thermomonas hydrothermalis]|uniref:Sulfation-dependent quorum factor, Ax21 family n=1 Tax=Thermomonas hydrothermalis TaxID=213588 RepID=A0A1M4YLR9_9GAMM|nr:diffusible signal factor-reguated Ax21 faimly protein [Thermomonas hydrothermalis]MCL6619139.1 Ax21 family protein [Thermomonas hydrothermalis]SHF06326.1 sulfation-dependent quorum factor, Ax21 family [Thermomonas hydrothermalis]